MLWERRWSFFRLDIILPLLLVRWISSTRILAFKPVEETKWSEVVEILTMQAGGERVWLPYTQVKSRVRWHIL